MAQQVDPRAGDTTGSVVSTAPATSAPTTEVAQDEALALKDRAADAASTVGQKAAGEVGALKDEAVGDARHLAGEAKVRVSAEADRAATEVAGALSEAAQDLQTMAAHAERPDGPVAGAVRLAGQRAETTARRLEERGSQGVVDDLTRFARNRPGLFLLGASVLGFAVGRVVRNTDTSSIVDAARSEISGDGSEVDDRGSATGGSGQRGSIDLRSERPELGQGPTMGPAAGMPGVVGSAQP